MKLRDHILLLLFAMALFLPFLGSAHLFDWDEINFAESAREMMITENWFQVQINFNPFWEKPPLFFWLQVLFMKWFGVGEFAARLPNALCGILTLQVFSHIGSKHHDRKFGLIWALVYAGSFLPHLYFKSGIIDPWFNLFIFLSIYSLYKVIEHPQDSRWQNALLAGVFTGLAVLTKGPVGFLLLLLTFLVWWIWNRFRSPAPLSIILTYAVSTAAVTFIWFGYETFSNGPWFLVEFITYQIDLFLNPVAGHKQPFFYHFVVVLLGCFPLSVIALPSFHNRFKGDADRLSLWMKYIFWVVLILFSIATTKIVHYSSMTYLPLSYLASLFIYNNVRSLNRLSKWQNAWILIQGLVISVALMGVPFLLYTKERWIDQVTDPFARASLNAPLDATGYEWLTGALYFGVIVTAFVINRKTLDLGFKVLHIGTAIVIFLTMPMVVPMIESLSQRPAIDFFERQQGKDVLLETYGYKSYAHYFYGRLQPKNAHAMDEHALKATNKPIMISVKVNRQERFLKEYPEAKFLSESGGFAFYQIVPPTSSE